MKKKLSLSRKSGRGSIFLISFLLIGSAAIRIGSGAGQAVATENLDAESIASETADVTAPTETNRGDISTLLKALQEREARLSETEQKIAVRKKALSVADEEIEKKLAVLQDAENSLRSLLALANTAAEDDLARLTAVYENMKPKDAANLFEEMEPAFAAGFLGRMRADSAAGIMAGLTPEAAYTISVILAGRNADVPKG